jgi:hypothetical protein
MPPEYLAFRVQQEQHGVGIHDLAGLDARECVVGIHLDHGDVFAFFRESAAAAAPPGAIVFGHEQVDALGGRGGGTSGCITASMCNRQVAGFLERCAARTAVRGGGVEHAGCRFQQEAVMALAPRADAMPQAYTGPMKKAARLARGGSGIAWNGQAGIT